MRLGDGCGVVGYQMLLTGSHFQMQNGFQVLARDFAQADGRVRGNGRSFRGGHGKSFKGRVQLWDDLFPGL